ncbi:hypothetical protein CN514_05965 [Bacillus sp. AFS001701]|nr:hypothetical protein [Bacillus sp. AFS001701]PET71771.1 hypothetical protein CN514_05965 [Bacillus sp. AFS001701]
MSLKYIITLIVVLTIFITGCSNLIGNEEQNIEVQKRVVDVNNYEDFKVITNNEKVQKVRELLDNIDWEHTKVDMVRPADYRFIFQFKNPDINGKAVLYELWISPNNDKVELTINAESKFVQLDKNHSEELYEILIGGKLSDLN